MKNRNRLRKFLVPVASVAVTLAILPVQALAESAQEDTLPDSETASAKGLEEIVVTGTLIRGIAPMASQSITMDVEAIEVTGATSVVDLLTNVPQFDTFLGNPSFDTNYNTAISSNTANLRGVGTTLVLMDGHRVAGAGIKSTIPDPDFLPPVVIERLEVVTDGGTSIYGADAVSGVLNFATLRRFDGVRVNARYGAADNYDSYDANILLGKDWGRGSAYVAYNYAFHDQILGKDRNYVKRLDWATGQQIDLQCTPGNTTVKGTVYGLPALTANQPNLCDLSRNSAIQNEDERDSVFGSFTYDFSDRLRFDVRGFYTERDRTRNFGELVQNVTIGPSSPQYRDTGDANSGQTQNVSVNFGPVFGDETPSKNNYEIWNITPSLSLELAHDWQMRLLASYGEGDTKVSEQDINFAELSAGVASGTIDPYDIASNDPAVLFPVGNYHIYGKSENTLGNARAVFDGPLFSIPGGELFAAFGAEYIYEDYKAVAGDAVRGMEDMLPSGGGDRDVYAAFGEINIPIVGQGNNFTGVHAVNLNLSGRYDDYSDFGDTFNPKVGLNYQPVEWINLRGNWGESFTAPSLAASNAVDNEANIFPYPVLTDPLNPPQSSPVWEILMRGGERDLLPEEAETYSAGFDIEPPFIPNLKISATYYDMELEGTLDRPPVAQSSFWRDYPNLFILYPTEEEALAVASEVPNGADTVAQAYAPGTPPVYLLLDARRRNLGKNKMSGIDFQIYYTRDTSIGSLFAQLNGNYRLTDKRAARVQDPYGSDTVEESTRLRFRAVLGTRYRNLLAQVSLNYSGGWDVIPTSNNNFQDEVDDFKAVNLFFKYDIQSLDDLSVTLAVDNVFDEEPPTYMGIYNVSYNGYAPNGNPVGRLVQVGIDKRF